MTHGDPFAEPFPKRRDYDEQDWDDGSDVYSVVNDDISIIEKCNRILGGKREEQAGNDLGGVGAARGDGADGCKVDV